MKLGKKRKISSARDSTVQGTHPQQHSKRRQDKTRRQRTQTTTKTKSRHTLAHHDKTHFSDKGYNSEFNIFGVMSIFNLEFLSKLLIKWSYLKIIEDI